MVNVAELPGQTGIGLIYPPPEVRGVVDKTASFVARNGYEFQNKIAQTEVRAIPRMSRRCFTPRPRAPRCAPFFSSAQHRIRRLLVLALFSLPSPLSRAPPCLHSDYICLSVLLTRAWMLLFLLTGKQRKIRFPQTVKSIPCLLQPHGARVHIRYGASWWGELPPSSLTNAPLIDRKRDREACRKRRGESSGGRREGERDRLRQTD